MSYSSLSIVEDITTLALLSVKGTVIVTDPIRGGTFIWSSANLSTPVTNDPGQGIWVAPSSAPTGASGAWIRQFTDAFDLQFWGAIGDGTTDSSLALANFGVFGRYIASLYGGLELFVPPGHYLIKPDHNDAMCYNALCNLGKFRMVMPGTQWTNIGATPFWSWFIFAQAELNGNGGNENAYINTTTVGAQTFTFQVPADSSNYHVGDVVMLASIDVQGYGYPANPQQREYVTITDMTNSATTGVTGIAEFIRYEHRSDFPDFTTVAWETILSGSYNAANGHITLSTAGGVRAIGTPVQVYLATGTGAWASLSGTWPAITGTTGSTYVLQGPSVAASTIGSGTFSDSYTFGGFGGNNACGRARVWQLNTSGWSYGNGAGNYVQFPNGGKLIWDCDYELVGPSTINPPLNGAATLYNTISLRKFTSHHITGYGWSESICQDVHHEFHKPISPLLPDKCVSSLSHHKLDASATGFSAQNVFDFVRFDQCKFGTFNSASIKNLQVDECEISFLGVGGNALGVSNSQIFNNCRVYNVPSQNGFYDCAPAIGYFTVDGANIVYTTAVDSVLGSTYGVFKTLINGLSGTGWATRVPGSYLVFSATSSNYFSGTLGTMRVLRTWQDYTWIYTVVDSPLTAVPAWSTGFVYSFLINEVEFNNCTGCDQVRVFSENCKNGLKFADGHRFLFSGLTGNHSGTNPLWLPAGEISKVTANVISAGGTSGTTLAFAWVTFDYSNSYTPDSGGTVVTINTGVAGKRVFTQSASTTTFLGTDGITVGGSSSTHLPTTRIVGNLTYSTSLTGTGNQTPIVDIVIEYDTGQVCRLVPTQFNQVGDAIINVAGRLL